MWGSSPGPPFLLGCSTLCLVLLLRICDSQTSFDILMQDGVASWDATLLPRYSYSGTNEHYFKLASDPLASGGRAMVAVPIIGWGYVIPGYVATCVMNWTVTVPTSDTYQIWMRARPSSSASHSVRVGVDGNSAGNTIRLDWTSYNPSTYSWSAFTDSGQTENKWTIAAGVHTIYVLAREDGAFIDRIYITNKFMAFEQFNATDAFVDTGVLRRCDQQNGGCDPRTKCFTDSCGACPPGFTGSGEYGCLAVATDTLTVPVVGTQTIRTAAGYPFSTSQSRNSMVSLYTARELGRCSLFPNTTIYKLGVWVAQQPGRQLRYAVRIASKRSTLTTLGGSGSYRQGMYATFYNFLAGIADSVQERLASLDLTASVASLGRMYFETRFLNPGSTWSQTNIGPMHIVTAIDFGAAGQANTVNRGAFSGNMFSEFVTMQPTKNGFSARGYISPPSTGLYEFTVRSGDGSVFYLDTNRNGVIDPADAKCDQGVLRGLSQNFWDAPKFNASLTVGEYYMFAIGFWNDITSQQLTLYWRQPLVNPALITAVPATAFFILADGDYRNQTNVFVAAEAAQDETANQYITYDLTTPIVWDGASSLLIEVSEDANSAPGPPVAAPNGGTRTRADGTLFASSSMITTGMSTCEDYPWIDPTLCLQSSTRTSEVLELRMTVDRSWNTPVATVLTMGQSSARSATANLFMFFSLTVATTVQSVAVTFTKGIGAPTTTYMFMRAGAYPTWLQYDDTATTLTTATLTIASPAIGTTYYLGLWTTGSHTYTMLANIPPPVISGITPSVGPTVGDTSVTINGQDFGPVGNVTINGALCATTQRSSIQIVCTSPPGQGTLLGVVVYSQQSSRYSSSYNQWNYAAPTINNINPPTAPTVGSVLVTVNGANFGLTPAVTVAGVAQAVLGYDPVPSLMAQVVFMLPAGVGSGVQIRVTVGGQSATSTAFAYTAPALESVFPQRLTTQGGVNVTITGSNFGPTFAAATAKIGGTTCPVVWSNHTMLVCVMPPGQDASQAVQVTIGGQPSSGSSVVYNYALPALSTISYSGTASTAGGYPITIQGMNLGLSGASVTVGAQACTVVPAQQNHTQIVCTIAAGESSDLTVLVAVGTQNAPGSLLWSYDPPSVSLITPPNGPTGPSTTPIVLSGANFGRLTSLPGVTVNGLGCTVTAVSADHTQLTCTPPTVPANTQVTSKVPVVVSVGNQGTSANNLYGYDKPIITGVSPAFMPTAGGTVQVTGFNFGVDGTVTVDGRPCTFAGTHPHTSVTCTLASGVGGNVTVLALLGNQNASSARVLSYLAPTLWNINPRNGPTQGGTAITLTGANFGQSASTAVPPAGSYVLIGTDKLCAMTFGASSGAWTHNSITCYLPANAGLVNLAVKVVVGGQNVTSNSSLLVSYDAPTITRLTPANGPTQGLTGLLVEGSSFDALSSQTGGAPRAILIGGVPCVVTDGTWTDTEVVCDVAPYWGVSAAMGVSLTTGLGQSSTPFNSFRFDAPTVTGVAPVNGFATVGGDTFMIDGTNFGGFVAAANVTVGAFAATVTANSHTSLTVRMPRGQGLNLAVKVFVGDRAAVQAGPTITYLPPTFCCGTSSWTYTQASITGGDTITINGANFGTNPSVLLGAIASCSNVVVGGNHDVLTCTLPAYVQSNIRISAASQATVTLTFLYQAPTPLAIQPTEFGSQGGVSVAINGLAMGGLGGAMPAVSIGGTPCTPVTVYNNSFIRCTLAAGVGANLKVNVRQNNVDSPDPGITFSYLPPNITSITPSSGITDGGYLIVINGTSFGASTGLVSVGGVACSTSVAGTSWSHTRVVCSIASGEGAQQRVVVTAGLQPSPDVPGVTRFDYLAPNVTSVSPRNGPTSGVIALLIQGTSFGPAGQVFIGTRECLSTGYTHSSITCTLPAGSGRLLPVTVNSATRSSAANANGAARFSYDAPIITSIAPLPGNTQGGDTLTISGSGFGLSESENVIMVGTFVCGAQSVVQYDRVECVRPAGVGTNLKVNISVAGQLSNSDKLFSYAAPTISSIVPLTSGTAGGEPVVITGTNFGPGTSGTYTLTFNGAVLSGTAAVVSATHTQIQFNTPEGRGAANPIVLSIAGRQATYSGGGFVYAAPTVSSVAGCAEDIYPVAAGCLLTGGDTVTVTGTNFGALLAQVNVTVGGLVCSNLALLTPHTTLRCKLPPNTGFNLPVVVTVMGLSGSAPYVSHLGPTIIPGTLVNVNDTSQAKGTVFVRQTLPTYVRFQARNLNTTNMTMVSVRYGSAAGVAQDISAKQFPCVLQRLTTPDADRVSNVTCIVGRGVGGGLVFQIKVGNSNSFEGSDTLSYDPPVVLNTTIRGDYRLPGSFFYKGKSSAGDVVYFDALNIGDNANLLSVTYANAETAGSCSGVQIVTNVTIGCKTQPGAGGDYHFRVLALNQLSDPGGDTYAYQNAPVILQVSGCVDSDPETLLCPTEGGVQIRVNGTDFVPLGMTVRVGPTACAPVIVPLGSNATLTCTLPPGVGLKQSVSIVSGAEFSVSKRFVSYRAPTLQSISGCTGAGVRTVDCPRARDTTITLTGTNFGESGAQIYVGGEACLSSEHDPNSRHTKMTCVLPHGASVETPVYVVQALGQTSTNRLSLSYSQCQEGEYSPANLGDTTLNVNCTKCPPGTYSIIKNAVACDACPSGTFATQDGAVECAPCSAGSYSVSSGAIGPVVCTNCTAGQFSSSPLQTTCGACAAGSFNNGTGLSYCVVCNAGSVTNIAGLTVCTRCTAGSFAALAGSVQCGACPVGTSSRAGQSSCTSCLPGTIAALGSSPTCAPCNPGYFVSAEGQAACGPCDSGSFANTTGLSACEKCPPGKFSLKSVLNEGATGCTPCDKGQYGSSAGASACQTCLLGFYSDQPSSSSCLGCPPGSFQASTDFTKCVLCSPGSATADLASQTCSSCLAGYFAGANATSCSPCAPGKYASSPSSAVCTNCSEGSVAQSFGSATCSLCESGQAASIPGLSACVNCVAGKYSVRAKDPDTQLDGAKQCVPCAPGSYAGQDQSTSCLPCPSGAAVAAGGATACVSCAPGSIASSSGSQLCANCSAGEWSEKAGGVTCESCTAGRYSRTAGSSTCADCVAGSAQSQSGKSTCGVCGIGLYASSDRSSSCLPCPAGSYSGASNAVNCTVCPRGFISGSPASGSCSPCGTGKYIAREGQTVCLQCEPGNFANTTGLSACYACTRGSAAGSGGVTACTVCDPGYFSSIPGALQCQTCARGRYSLAGWAECAQCPPGSVQPQPTSSSCNLCIAGSYNGDSGKLTCVPCAAGTVSSTANATVCPLCPAGTVSANSGYSTCTNCTLGRYVSFAGNLQCSDCPSGRYADKPATAVCDGCPPGWYQPLTGKSFCTRCDPGYYSPSSGFAACVPCESGTYSDVLGASVCPRCAAGAFSKRDGVTALTSCTNCTEGFYQSSAGQESCPPCPPGSFSDKPRAKGCTQCAMGSYAGSSGSTSGATSCRPCDRGFYAPSNGSVSCSQCPPGSYSDGPGVAVCTLCQPGWVQPENGRDFCSQCPKGYFQSSSGQQTCFKCPVGRFGTSLGLPECPLCPPGSYAPDSGLTICSPCLQGKFSGVPGAAQCLDCEAGTATDAESSTNCTACDPGAFQSDLAQARCNLCQIGRYTATTRQVACLACEPGRFGNGTGRTTCFECDSTTYQGEQGKSECLPCPEGTASRFTGRSSCARCEPGTYNPFESQLLCEFCVAGSAQPSQGQPNCTLCTPGTFSDDRARQCQQCIPGRYNNIYNATVCEFCEQGRFQLHAGQAGCDLCGLGTFSGNSSGATVCMRCPTNAVARVKGAVSCDSCQTELSIGAQATPDQTDCQCPPGQYSYYLPVPGHESEYPPGARNPNITSQAFQCNLCPTGANCDLMGATYVTLYTRPGWWRVNGTDTYYPCLLKVHCIGGLPLADVCAANRGGPICARCNYGYQEQTGQSNNGGCVACPPAGNAFAFTAVVFLFVGLGLVGMYWLVLRADRYTADKAREYDERLESMWEEFQEDKFASAARREQQSLKLDGIHTKPGFTYKLKICLSFFQVTTNLAFALRVPYPQIYLSFIGVFNLANFDFIQWASVGCVVKTDYYLKFVVFTLVPIFLFLSLLAFFYVPAFCHDRKERLMGLGGINKDRERVYRLRRNASIRNFWKLVVFTLFLIYPFVSATTLRLYVCRFVGGQYYLVSDFTIQCYDRTWYAYALGNILTLAIYPVGVPLSFFYLLRKNRDRLSQPAIKLQLGFLYDGYSRRVWWFECVDMLNKLFLTSLLAFFPEPVQIPLGMVWCVSYTMFILQSQPYMRKGDDRLHLFAQIILYLLILSGHILLSLNELRLDDAADLGLGVGMILVTLAFIFYFLYQLYSVLRRIYVDRQRVKVGQKATWREDEVKIVGVSGQFGMVDDQVFSPERFKFRKGLDDHGMVKSYVGEMAFSELMLGVPNATAMPGLAGSSSGGPGTPRSTNAPGGPTLRGTLDDEDDLSFTADIAQFPSLDPTVMRAGSAGGQGGSHSPRHSNLWTPGFEIRRQGPQAASIISDDDPRLSSPDALAFDADADADQGQTEWLDGDGDDDAAAQPGSGGGAEDYEGGGGGGRPVTPRSRSRNQARTKAAQAQAGGYRAFLSPSHGGLRLDLSNSNNMLSFDRVGTDLEFGGAAGAAGAASMGSPELANGDALGMPTSPVFDSGATLASSNLLNANDFPGRS